MLELIAAATVIHPNLFGVLWILAAVFSLSLSVRQRFTKRDADPLAADLTTVEASTTHAAAITARRDRNTLDLVRLWWIAFTPLLVISLVSVIKTDIPLSRIEIAEVLIGGTFLAAGMRWIRISPERLINAAAFGSFLALAIAILDLTVFDYGRAGRSFHPINFAVAVGCLLLVLIHAVMDASAQRRPMVLAALTAGVIAIILSESRGPMLSIILALGLTWGVTHIFRRPPGSEASKPPTWIGVVGLGIALTLILFAAWRTWNELHALGQSASLQVRLQILVATLNQIRETPVFGIGVDQAGEFFAAVTLPEQGINHAHSSLLNATLEMGLPGGFAWCWAFLALGWGVVQNSSGVNDQFAWRAGLSFVLFFFFCSLTQDLLSHSFTRKLIAFYPVILLAMLSQRLSKLPNHENLPNQSR